MLAGCVLTGSAVRAFAQDETRGSKSTIEDSAPSRPLVAPAAAEELERLVEALGAPEFATRQQASEALLAAGPPALVALRAGLSSSDLEIALRCEQISTVIQQRVMAESRAKFLDAEEPAPYAPAGWTRFAEIVGDSRHSREFFLEMHEAEPELMSACGAEGSVRGKLLATRARQLQDLIVRGQKGAVRLSRTQTIPAFTVATLMYVMSLDKSPGTAANSLQMLLNYSDVKQRTMASNQQEIWKGLLANLLRQALGGDDPQASHLGQTLLPLAMAYQVKEVLPMAMQMLKSTQQGDKFQGNGTTSLYALLTVAKFGDKSQIPELIPFMADDRSVWTWHVNNEVRTTQVGDVALAACLYLAGQDLSRFHYDSVSMTGDTVFQPYTLSFLNAEDRQKSREAWAIYQATGKLPEPPADDANKDNANKDNAEGRDAAKDAVDKTAARWPDRRERRIAAKARTPANWSPAEHVSSWRVD